MANQFAVSIASYSAGSIARNAVGTPTLYHIETRDRDDRLFQVSHRYSDFLTLHAELAPHADFPVPKRTVQQKLKRNDSSLRDRQRGLEHYLKCAVADAGDFLHPALRHFLAVPEASPSERTDAPWAQSSEK